jgi:D-3-phosphoglycerate dehydrogenase
MSRLLVTDHTFQSLDVERRLLAPHGVAVEEVGSAERSDLLAKLPTADFVLTQFARLDKEAVSVMDRVKVIVRYGIGVDNIDLEAARGRGIPVCNVPDYCIDEVADHTLALILAATRRVVENANYVSDGRWGLPVSVDSMRCLKTMTVGIIGFGRIGREVAARLVPFKCRIVVYDPGVSPQEIEACRFEAATLEKLIVESDVISVHCPATPETRHLINADIIDAMKPGAILVNIARGNVVCSQSLLNALKSGKVGFAALDVFDPEPPAADDPIRTMPNVILHSHIASASADAVFKLRHDAASIVALAAERRPLHNVVNGLNPDGRHEVAARHNGSAS